MITYTDDTIGNQLSHFVQAMALKFRKVDDAIDQPEGRKSHEHYFNDTPVPGYTTCACPHPLVTAEPVPRTTVCSLLQQRLDRFLRRQQRLQRLYCRKPVAKSTHTKHPLSVYFLKTQNTPQLCVVRVLGCPFA